MLLMIRLTTHHLILRPIYFDLVSFGLLGKRHICCQGNGIYLIIHLAQSTMANNMALKIAH